MIRYTLSLLLLLPAALSAQHVGINIETPTVELDIRTNSVIDGSELSVGNMDNSYFTRLFSGRPAKPFSLIYWKLGYPLAFGTSEQNGSSFSEWMRINHLGNVGIGKTNPDAKLDIQSPGDGGELLRFSTPSPWRFRQSGTGSGARLSFQPLFGTGTFEIIDSDSSNRAAVFYSSWTNSEVYLVPDAGNVGVGTMDPTEKLHVEGTVYAVGGTSGGYAVHGKTNALHGSAILGEALNTNEYNTGVYGRSWGESGEGVYGVSNGTSGRGVYGRAFASSGNAVGVRGDAISPDGTGIYGAATAASGSTKGVYGFVNSETGTGVYGHANSSIGLCYGVYGSTFSNDGVGVYGVATAASGETRGVYGVSNSTTGSGIRGHANVGSGENYGVYGTSSSSSGTGVYGHALASGPYVTYGVYGKVSSQGTGVYGENTRTSGPATGVVGKSASSGGTGVYGTCTSTSGTNYGVWGTTPSTSGRGVYGIANATSGTTYGVYGQALSSSGSGIYGSASGDNGKALHGNATGLYGKGIHAVATGTHSSVNAILAQATGGGSAWAGWFTGDVHVDGNLSKASGSFKIDHPLDPENKYLYHSFVESPDMMNVYNGNVTTDSRGYAVVDLPEYFEALNQDFRYQLTVIGAFAQAMVSEEISHNQFVIRTDKPNLKVSWQVTGVRKDPWAQANRIVPEVEKEPENKGKYLTPTVYGRTRMQGIGHWEAGFETAKK